MTDLTTTARPAFETPAAVARARAKTSRWATAINSLSSAIGALFTDSRPPAQRCVPRRSVYLENGVMSREMHRL
jgi:hypothetical protein